MKNEPVRISLGCTPLSSDMALARSTVVKFSYSVSPLYMVEAREGMLPSVV